MASEDHYHTWTSLGVLELRKEAQKRLMNSPALERDEATRKLLEAKLDELGKDELIQLLYMLHREERDWRFQLDTEALAEKQVTSRFSVEAGALEQKAYRLTREAHEQGEEEASGKQAETVIRTWEDKPKQ